MPFGWAAAATVVAAGIGAYASHEASKAQSESAAAANALQRTEYDQTRADQQPWRDAGYSALGRMSDLLGLSGHTGADGYGSLNQRFTPGDLQNDPGYQFELAQGTKTLQNSAAARGGLYSGATLKALTQYGNDYAGTKYNEAYNRFNQDQNTTYNRLASQAGLGQVSTQQVDAAGQHMADQVGSNLIGAGNARGAADLSYGNIAGNALNQGAAWWQRQQQPYNHYQQPGYAQGYNGQSVNQGTNGGDASGSYWGVE